MPLQHICPQVLKGPLVSFCPHRNDLTLVHREDWFQNTSAQLSPAEKAQENALCLRPDCLYSVSPSASLSLRKGTENPAAGNQISFVSAFTRVWTGQAGENVSIGPYHIWYYTLHLNISEVFFFYLPVSFSTFFTMAPMPSKILCNSVSHINAGVVTTLFFVSTWASVTSFTQCFPPSSLMAPAVPA